MHHHLQEGDGGNANIFEVVGIGSPRLCIIDCFLLRNGVVVKGVAVLVDELDAIIELWWLSISG